MTPASRSRPVRRSSGSVTPSNSGYNPRTWLKRAAFTSHTAFRVQLASPLKLRTRSGPQYPQPITPTEIGRFIFSDSYSLHGAVRIFRYRDCLNCSPPRFYLVSSTAFERLLDQGGNRLQDAPQTCPTAHF